MSNKKKNYSEKPIENPNTEAEEFSSEKRDTIIIISEIALIVLLVILIIFLVFGRKNDNGSSGNNNSGNNGSGGENPSVDGGGEAEDDEDVIVETNKKSYKSYNFSYFDTMSTIVGYEEDESEFAATSEEAMALLGEYHKLFDIYNSYEGINNLHTINRVRNGEHQVVEVDRKIIDMLLYAKEMYTLTNGKMNIAMGSVLSIWHDYRTAGIDEPWNAQLPPMDKLTEAAKHTNIDDIIIDEENCTVYLADPKMKLDVGAIAKGYAVEMVAQMLESRGKDNYTVNVGGNIRTIGKKANGEKWLAGIENPTGDPELPYVEYIRLNGKAIVTSGSYQRYYVVGTKQYHHIIDDETLMPAERGFLSVSIICDDSGMGDGLSTALFCMTLEDGLALINSLDGVEAMWIGVDETRHYSDNFSKYIDKNR